MLGNVGSNRGLRLYCYDEGGQDRKIRLFENRHDGSRQISQFVVRIG